MSRLHISRSNNLENNGRTDTGQQFENTISSPDLRIGTTFAIFKSEGKRPLLNDLLHIWVNGVLILLLYPLLRVVLLHPILQSYL